jgi:Ca2+-binding EF-hand superfamily protein
LIAFAALAAAGSPAPAGDPPADAPVPEDLLKEIRGRARGMWPDVFAGLDKDGDGRLAAPEVSAEVVAALDGDGDGAVSKEEFLAKVGQGDPKAGKPRDPPKDAPADGEAFAEWAKRKVATDPRFDADARRSQFLRNFDRDPKDGLIQKKEYAAADADKVFRDFDLDKNGSLDDRELLLLMRDQLEDLRKARRRPTRANFLVLFDLDDDRRVTRPEYAFLRGPASAFTSYDDDGDGVVTYDELIYDRSTKDRRKRGKDAPEGPPPPEKRDVWTLYDKDGDGRVTPEEFGGGEAVFRRLDRNRDGFLTSADA